MGRAGTLGSLAVTRSLAAWSRSRRCRRSRRRCCGGPTPCAAAASPGNSRAACAPTIPCTAVGCATRSSPQCATSTPSSGRHGRRLRRPRRASSSPRSVRCSRRPRSWYVHVFGDRPGDLGRRRASTSRPSGGGCASADGSTSPVRTDDGGHELRQFSLWGGGFRRGPPRARRPAGRVPPADAVARRGAAPAGRGSTSCAASCASAPSNPTSDTEITEWFDDARRDGPRTGRRTRPPTPGVRLRQLRLRRRVPRAPQGRALRPPARPPPRHPARHADQPRHLAPVPARVAQPYLFGIPASDTDPGTVHGQQMHDVLRFVHEQGSCRDAAHVDDVLVAHGFDDNDRMRGRTGAAHRRCPSPATRSATRSHARASRTTRPRRSWRRRGSTRCGCTTACSTRATTRPGRCGATASPTTRRRGCRRGCSRRSPRRAVSACGSRSSTSTPRCVDDPEPFEPDADDLLAIEAELRR